MLNSKEPSVNWWLVIMAAIIVTGLWLWMQPEAWSEWGR